MYDIPWSTVLSNNSVGMMVQVAASHTSGKTLQKEDLARVMHAADVMLLLEEKKVSILEFVTNRMSLIAPNLTQLLGPEICAKLVGICGSIKTLSEIPSCNIQVLGAQKKMGGFSQTTVNPHFGIIAQSELIRGCPPDLQRKALRIVSAKTALCARVDCNQSGGSSEHGKKLYELCRKKIEVLQMPPPPKQKRPMAAPDNKPKKRRGGKRYRKMREKYRDTETARVQGRLGFGKPEEIVLTGDGQFVGLGMLTSASDVGGSLRGIQPKTNTSTLHQLNKSWVFPSFSFPFLPRLSPPLSHRTNY